MKIYVQISEGSDVLWYKQAGTKHVMAYSLRDTNRKNLGTVLDKVIRRYPIDTEYVVADIEHQDGLTELQPLRGSSAILKYIRTSLDKHLLKTLQNKGLDAKMEQFDEMDTVIR